MITAPDVLNRLLVRMRARSGVPAQQFDQWSNSHRADLLLKVVPLVKRVQPAKTPGAPRKSRSRQGGHADVGEVIPLARKHTWTPGTRVTATNLGSVEATDKPHKIVVKGNVVPDLELAAERERGATPGAVWLKRKILDAVASGPGSDKPNFRRLYVTGADWLVGRLEPLKTVAEVLDFVDDWHHAAQNMLVLPEIYTGRELEERFGAAGYPGSGYSVVYAYTPEQKQDHERAAAWRKAAYAVQDMDKASEQRAIMAKIEDAAQRRIPHDALQRAGLAANLKRLSGHRYQLYRRTEPAENVVGQQTVALAGVDENPTRDDLKKSHLLSLLTNVPTGFGGKPASFWKNDVPFARDLERKDDWTPLTPKEKPKSGATTGADDEKTSGRWTRAATGQRRKGPPTGVPAEVAGEDLLRTFGFRGVQYGNWVEEGSRGKYLSLAFEALSDLANLLGQPRAFISHDGQLALAFGARGAGQASAHFEPQLRVINLTHTRGDGSLAHEWGHFLDHELLADPTARKVLAGGKVVGSTASAHATPRTFRDRLTENASGSSLHPALSPEVAEAVRGVMKALHVPSPQRAEQLRSEREEYLSNIREQIAALGVEGLTGQAWRDKYNELVKRRDLAPTPTRTKFSTDAERLGTYFWTPTELFARAFETWAEDKLQELGRENTYLVYGTKSRYHASRKFRDLFVNGLEPYPHGIERGDITTAVDRLVTALAEHGLPTSRTL